MIENLFDIWFEVFLNAFPLYEFPLLELANYARGVLLIIKKKVQ